MATRSSALRVILRNWTRPAIVVHCSRKLEVRCGARHVDLRRGLDARAIEGGDWNPPVLLGVQVWFMRDGATGGLASPSHGEAGIAFATVVGVCVQRAPAAPDRARMVGMQHAAGGAVAKSEVLPIYALILHYTGVLLCGMLNSDWTSKASAIHDHRH